MIKLRIGVVLAVYSLVFGLSFLTGSDTFTSLGPQVFTRAQAVTYLLLGFILPAVTLIVGCVLAVLGRKKLGNAPTAGGGDKDVPPPDPPVGWPKVLPTPAAVVLVGAAFFLGVFGYGAGEVYSSPRLVHLGARLVRLLRACADIQSTGADVAELIVRGDWTETDVRRCAACLEGHPRCTDRAACEDVCQVTATRVPSISEFGGQVEPAFFGTWELVNGNGIHARVIYDANGFQKILDGDPNVVRGQWRARAADAPSSWEFLHVPVGEGTTPWVELVETMGDNRLRWPSEPGGGFEFERRAAEQVDAGPSQSRMDECRRACARWRSCMRDYQDSYTCQDDMSRSCRQCRDEGLGR